MTVSVVFAIAGVVALLFGIIGGGIKAKEIEVPLLPIRARIITVIIGFILLGTTLWLENDKKMQVIPIENTSQVTSAPPTPQQTSVSTPTLTPTQTLTDTATSTPEKNLYTYGDMVVGFIETDAKDGWSGAKINSFKDTASNLGIQLKFYNVQGDFNKQLSAFRDFIANKDVNVIVLAAVQSSGWDDVLKQAQAAGKIVVLEDNRIDAPEDLYATYVGPDMVEEGRKAAEAMCKLLEGSAKKNVVELVGDTSTSYARDRDQGFREKMGDCGITITQSKIGNWNATDSEIVMAALLNSSRDIQGVFAQNDAMGLGAIQALKASGLKPGTDVKIVSIDGSRAGFQAMIDGDLNVTVECSPDLAPEVYEAALKALNGETLPKWIPVEESVFFMDDPNLKEIAVDRKY
jgi:ABC-type sugar transport system substrate-binding protein